VGGPCLGAVVRTRVSKGVGDIVSYFRLGIGI
jgi:hypothetical protein